MLDDSVKPVLGQCGVVQEVNQVFLLQLDSVRLVLGQCGVVWDLNQVFGACWC